MIAQTRFIDFLTALLFVPAVSVLALDTAQFPPPADHEERQIVLAAVGDIMMPGSLQKAVAKHNHDYSLLFKYIAASLVAADLSFANLETPVDPARAVSGYPEFNARPELLKAVKDAGIDVLSIANNHMLDAGDGGLRRTIERIRSEGLTAVGAGLSREEARAPAIIIAGGIRIAFLAYTYGTNGGPPRKKKPLAFVNVMEQNRDLQTVETLVKETRSKADLIVLSLHWGEEYAARPTAWQKRAAVRLIEAGADIILGHHPHVLQPIEQHAAGDGRTGLVAYSLGNFISSQNFGVSHRNKNVDRAFRGDGVILKVTIAKGKDGAARIAGHEVEPVWTHRERLGGVILARPLSLTPAIMKLSGKERSKAEENMLRLLDYRREMILQRVGPGK